MVESPKSIKQLQQELKTHAVVLREALTSLDQKKTVEFLSIAIENTQALIQLTQHSPFQLLQPLMQTLHHYFQVLQEGMIFENKHLETLSLVIGELIQVSDLNPNRVENFLNSRRLSLNQSQKNLTHLLKQFKTQQDLKELAAEKEVLDFEETKIDATMFDLFCVEIETQALILNHGLIELEKNGTNRTILESLMRAAHSIKGAARVVSLIPIVHLAHAMEDNFVAIQRQQITLDVNRIDLLLQGVDILSRVTKVKIHDLNRWLREQIPVIQILIKQLKQKETASESKMILKNEPSNELVKRSESVKMFQKTFNQDRILRVTAQSLNRLMGLAGESLVESRWLYPFSEVLQQLKKEQDKLTDYLNILRDHLSEDQLDQIAQHALTHLQSGVNKVSHLMNERQRELDNFIRRHANLSDRLYQEVINSRMRPFADVAEGFPRMVRDLARQTHKQVRLEIEGQATPIDRDILEKLEAPLSHLIRNAVDHGIESPEERQALGKPAEGLICLEAHHRGGMLAITVSDDGRGIDINQLRRQIVEKNLASLEAANRLSDHEIIDFLFLPGFSTAVQVTEISGRGMGLNVVQNFIQEIGGVVRTIFTPGKGLSFNLQLPLTLSVIRALLVEIAGEPYAFPLARIEQAFLMPIERLEIIENRQFFHYEGQNIGLISAWQILELNEPELNLKNLPIIVLSDHLNAYGVVVDRLIGEKELVVQELDKRLGKISDISAGALMEDGSPLLIIDVEDIVRSIDRLLSGGRLSQIAYTKEKDGLKSTKRILVVDDSITVREVEARLLKNHGYTVDTASNGIDGWNAVRIGHYDLIITDLDMPRMNGIELVQAIKSDARLQHLPVMIVSYKEDEEDHIKGLAAGADYYMTKSSFHDAKLIELVKNLIGQP